MSRKAILLSIVFAAALLPAMPVPGQEYSEFGNPLTRLTIKGVPITAEVVTTPEKRYKGLSQRRELPEGAGMLFLFTTPGRYAFCMRDMHFPIDIIWIADGKVAGIHPNLSPADPRSFVPPVPVRLVLELPGGFADRHAIKAGDRLELQLPGWTAP